eukprot:5133585-Pyramimonas_sp.AAC.1
MCPPNDPRGPPTPQLRPHVKAEGAEGKTKYLCQNRKLRLKDRSRDPGELCNVRESSDSSCVVQLGRLAG